VDLPAWLLWLLPVPLATGAAVAWAGWRSRGPAPQDTADSVEEYERFRRAMRAEPRREDG
jgi:cytochrome c-type biogenesis protein CcmH/NrfF